MHSQHTEDSTIIAATPAVHELGMLPYQIVIRGLGDQHVVHRVDIRVDDPVVCSYSTTWAWKCFL